MTKAEFAVWAAALRTYFPRHSLLPNEQAIELWYRELQDLTVDVLSAALRKWVHTETWPPTIAELRIMAAEIVNGPAPDWGEAWGEVVRAIGRHGIYREAEALKSMSPLTQAAVKRIGWHDICMSENPETLRAQFRQIYQVVEQRETQDRQLPESLKAMITGLCMPALEDGHAGN